MSIALNKITDTEMRGVCKERIEALELWLRRLIDEVLTTAYGDYFTYADTNGNRVIKSELNRQIEDRQRKEPNRYPRKIDAILLDDAIKIICNHQLFNQHFQKPLSRAYPDGPNEAKTFLERLSEPRNNLAHANAISLRQAEQIVCYSNDVIDSIKAYYSEMGMQQEYNAPLILKLTDSLGQVYMRSQFRNVHDGGILKSFVDDSRYHLRPGDTLKLEIEVDPSFDPDSYIINWAAPKNLEGIENGKPQLVLNIIDKYVGQSFSLMCSVTSKRDWHRMGHGADDFLLLSFKILPPL